MASSVGGRHKTYMGDRMNKDFKSWLREHWLFCLIALQPILDVIAYFNQNDVATVAGYIRLVILLIFPIYLLFTLKEKKRFLLAMLVIGVYALLHVLNGFRVGYISLYFDVSYMVKVMQMPILAICFVYLIRDEQTKRQAFRGVLTSALLMGVFIVLAYITGTGNETYGPGLGYSGWVIDDNRCANSILLVTLSSFAVGFSAKTERKLFWVAIPVAVAAAFLTNGTKACFYALFGIFAAYAVFLVMQQPLLKKKIRWLLVVVLILLMVFTVMIYPYTPRYRVNIALAKANTQGEIEAAALAKGYDVTTMSTEERFNTPEVKEIFEYYYWRYLGVLPDLIDRFGMDRVLLHYDMTTNVKRLIDVRVMERSYSAMIFEDSDLLTKLVGFEVSNVGFEGTYDMENDWPAIFYYYGYLGFALYIGFLFVFLLRVLKKLLHDFKGSFTADNFTLLLTLMLQFGLAQYSGAILRRPNVSVYMALILGLIWFQTKEKEARA